MQKIIFTCISFCLLGWLLSACSDGQSRTNPSLQTVPAENETVIETTSTPKPTPTFMSPKASITTVPTKSIQISTAPPILTVVTSEPILTATSTVTITLPRSVENSSYWAIVEPDRAYFWFKIDPELLEWQWHLLQSNQIEYRWSVEFPALELTYAAAVTMMGDDRQILENGSFEGLLDKSHVGIWLVDWNMLAKMNHRYPDAVQASYYRGGLLIELIEPDLVTSLYENHPEHIVFATYSHNYVIPRQKINVWVIYR